MPNESSGPLAGIRVLELGNFIAAPTAGRLLAEFGAEVIKVERPKQGDELRTWRAHGLSPSLFFRLLARNKKSITIDLRCEDGQEIVRRLAGTADIVLENFRPGTLERWNLGPELLRRRNSKLIIVRISGFGQTGPYAGRAGFGVIAEAMGGIRHVTGMPDQMPVRVGISLGDQLAALYAVIGALLGLEERRRGASSEIGESVDVALYEAVYSLMESAVPDYAAFGVIPGAIGANIHGVAPSGTYACADGRYAVIGANGDRIFPRLMTAIGREDLGADPELATNGGRLARRDELNIAIGTWTKTQTSDAVVKILADAGVPCGKIYTVADITKDAQYAAREMLLPTSVEIDGTRKEIAFPGIVPKLTLHPGSVRHLGPELGENTGELLSELGYAAEEIEGLAKKGVV